MANDATYDLGSKQIDRIIAASRLHGIDTRKSTERWLCEEVSRGFSRHILVPHLIKGGLLHPQQMRQTSDLDILFGRKMSTQEIYAAIEAMKPDLEAVGIVLKSYSKPEPLWMDGECGERYHIEAYAGKTRINTHIDVTGGTHLFPRHTGTRRHGSLFFKGQEPLLGFYQSLEAQAADKLTAVVLRPDTTRWKDFHDLAMLGDMGLDERIIAAEIIHRLRRKAANPAEVMSMLPELPEAMKYDVASQQGMRWQVWANRNKVAGDWEDTLCRARNLYATVRDLLLTSFEVANRIPRAPHHRQQPDFKTRIEQQAAARRAEHVDNVVEIAQFRSAAPGYRPRGM